MPTICSACGRTSGKCESCIKVDAVLTDERIHEIHGGAFSEWGMAIGGQPISIRFARAISREVVAVLAREPLTDEQLAKLAVDVEDEFLLYCDQDEFNEIARAVEQAHGISTPAASGIGESGGEAA